MILLAFDVDGTLRTSGGHVPVEVLAEHTYGGPVAVGVVSPSPHWPREEMPWLDKQFAISGPDRLEALRRLRARYPNATVRIYISDNKDQTIAEQAGFAYVEAADFAKGVGGAGWGVP